MNSKMLPYYLSRVIFACLLGIIFFVSGSPVWSALLIGGLVFAFFLWAPHSGRYSVHPDLGVFALRRDEHTQMINDKAARNAFVVSMLLIAAAAIYFGSTGVLSIPLGVLQIVLMAGVLTYLVSDFWFRKSHQ